MEEDRKMISSPPTVLQDIYCCTFKKSESKKKKHKKLESCIFFIVLRKCSSHRWKFHQKQFLKFTLNILSKAINCLIGSFPLVN